MITALQMLAVFSVSLGIFIAIFLTIFGGKIFSVLVPVVTRGLAEGKLFGWNFGRKNFGFTLVGEGQCKIVKANGKFLRCIIVYEGFGFDQYWNIRHLTENRNFVGPTSAVCIEVKKVGAFGQTPKAKQLEKALSGHWDEKLREYIGYIVAIRPSSDNTEEYKYNSMGQEIEPNDPQIKYPGRLPRWMPAFLSKHMPGGIWWIGNPFSHEIHTYNFQWTTLRQKQVAGELVDEFYFQDLSDSKDATGPPIDYIDVLDDIFWARIKGCETNDPIPVDITFGMTIRVVNPYKALFRIEQWLESTINRAMPSVRAWVAQIPYITAIKKDETTEREKDAILTKTGIDEYIERHWGVRIKGLNIKNIDPADGQIRDATTAEYRATTKAKAMVAEARGEAKAFTTVAKAIQKEPMGETILTARTLQRMSENPAATIVHANKMSGVLLNIPAGAKSAKPEPKPEGGNP